jgi:hypothetical protein
MITKNVAKSTMISMTMLPGEYGVMRIARLSASLASCKSTRCRHWATAQAKLPQRPQWLTILNEKNKTH